MDKLKKKHLIKFLVIPRLLEIKKILKDLTDEPKRDKVVDKT